MASAIGVTADGIRKLFRLPPGAEHSAKSPAHRCISIIKHEMSPGSGDNLQSKILRQINDVVHWESISPKAVREDGSDSRTVSLSRWVRDTFVLGSAKAMFGDSLLKVDPRFTESFFSFDDQSWKLLYGMPGQALDPAFKAIRNVQDTFRKFLELPVNERSDTSDMIRKMQASIKEGGVSDSDVATFMSMVYWGYVPVYSSHSHWANKCPEQTQMLGKLVSGTWPLLSKIRSCSQKFVLRSCLLSRNRNRKRPTSLQTS